MGGWGTENLWGFGHGPGRAQVPLGAISGVGGACCAACGTALPPRDGVGRPRRWCSKACKERNHRRLTPRTPRPRKVRAPSSCERCGAVVLAPRRGAVTRWCSPQCARGTVVPQAQRRVPSATCAHCATVFQPKGRDRMTYCSRACSFAAKAAAPKFCKVEFPTCRVCARPFAARHGALLCSDKCRKADAAALERAAVRREPRPPQACLCCGREFVAEIGRGKATTVCSHKCRRRLDGQRERAAGRRGTHRSRARRAGVAYEPFPAREVLARDGWWCQLCGVKTPARLRGTTDPRAPELDHIIPIAAGGAHTRLNTQCACRACNSAKGATPRGQLRLVA